MRTPARLAMSLSFTLLAGCAARPTAPPFSRGGASAPVSVAVASAHVGGGAPLLAGLGAAAHPAASSALPSGWFVPTELAPIPTPREGTFRARQAMLAEERRITPVALDVQGVPVSDVTPEVDLRKEPKELPIAERAAEVLTVDSRVVVRGRRFGRIVVGWDGRPFFAWAEGGVGPHSSHGITRIEYVAFAAFADGTAEVEEMQGWYDLDAKTAVALRRVKAKAVALAGGLAYAYRTKCPTCVDKSETLHVLTPDSGWNAPFTHTSFDLSEQKGGSFLATFSPGAIETWRKSGATPTFRRNTRFGIEVTRASADAAPVAFVHAGEVTL